MGKHFDSLVEIIREQIPENLKAGPIPDLKKYLTKTVNETSLFNLNLSTQDLRPLINKDFVQYNEYIDDFLALSKKYGKFVATPFEITGIEDKESVVIMESIGTSSYRLIMNKIEEKGMVLMVGEVDFKERQTNGRILMDLKGYYSQVWENGEEKINPYFLTKKEKNLYIQVLAESSLAWLEEAIYIMDPDNFIIRTETNQSKKQREKQERKNKDKEYTKPQKTIMRPHYKVLNTNETILFVKGESKEPVNVGIVRGHTKKLISERYKTCKGNILIIEQYNRGPNRIIGRNGKEYEIITKKSDLTLDKF